MDVLSRNVLLALREVASTGTMRAAADVLGVTPGAISQQFSALEARLGVGLTERVGRNIRLSPAGEVLLEHSARILDAQDVALAALESVRAGTTGVVTLGLFGSSASLISAIVDEVTSTSPGIDVRAREIDVDEALAAVRRGLVDLAFGLDYPDAPIARDSRVDVAPLLSEDFGLAVATHDPWQGACIDLAEASERPWILAPASSHYGAAVRAACRRVGFEPRVVHEVTDTASSLALAAAGQGVTPVTPLMRELVPATAVQVVALREPMTRDLCLAEPRRPDRRPAARAVADAIRRVATQRLNDADRHRAATRNARAR